MNPTREDQLMEVPSKSRLFTLKHLPFKCLHMPHREALQGEQKSKKAKFHQFRSSSCGSGQWLFCFFPSFFVCFPRVITGSKRIAFALNFDSLSFFYSSCEFAIFHC